MRLSRSANPWVKPAGIVIAQHMPVMAISLGVAFGLSGSNLAVVACCASVPSASNAYVLARQMGGDAPLLAQILTWQTALAVLTMPIFITFAGR